jgi:hypothetical protein
MRRDRIWAGENELRKMRRVTWGTVYRSIYDGEPALQVDDATRHDDQGHAENDCATLRAEVHSVTDVLRTNLQLDDAQPQQPTPSDERYPSRDEPSVRDETERKCVGCKTKGGNCVSNKCRRITEDEGNVEGTAAVEKEAKRIPNREWKKAKRAFNSYIPPEGQEETRAEEEGAAKS